MKRTAVETLLEIHNNLCYFLVSVLSISNVPFLGVNLLMLRRSKVSEIYLKCD